MSVETTLSQCRITYERWRMSTLRSLQQDLLSEDERESTSKNKWKQDALRGLWVTRRPPDHGTAKLAPLSRWDPMESSQVTLKSCSHKAPGTPLRARSSSSAILNSVTTASGNSFTEDLPEPRCSTGESGPCGEASHLPQFHTDQAFRCSTGESGPCGEASHLPQFHTDQAFSRTATSFGPFNGSI
ncbi:hypothetical protein TREES_T100021044 [Tupaia chinensis]|uniref:Uncharacterized protein n=1 Tax=Tupaia chinensis TaxID=246437 RepID=L9JAD7_TUPCH|nr:hypothetical protein TREES_T100021044 [Tupaia chinensis]